MSRRPRISRLSIGTDELVVLSLPSEVPDAQLTRAEREIARGLLAGKTLRQIAYERGRSLATVDNQVERLYRKLGVGSRAELIVQLLGEEG